LSAIAHGRGVQLWAEERFGLQTNLLLRHQTENGRENPKWVKNSKVLRYCLGMEDWDFTRGSQWNEFYDRQDQLYDWMVMDRPTRKRLECINGRPMKGIKWRDPQPIRPQDLDEGIQVFQKVWARNDRPPIPKSATLSLPYLYSESLDNNLLVDHYLDDFRKLFVINPECCDQVPDPDESVLHYRNFATELRQSRGLEDVSPQQTASVLFGHLKAGDKIAITAREHNERLQAHVDALEARGLQVRVISGQGGIQDFCFLAKAEKELVGNFQSTFAFWAAMLGTARRARLYTLDSPRLRNRYGPTVEERFQYNWTHPELKGRVQLDIIRFGGNKRHQRANPEDEEDRHESP
jgi:hypothetical protein